MKEAEYITNNLENIGVAILLRRMRNIKKIIGNIFVPKIHVYMVKWKNGCLQ